MKVIYLGAIHSSDSDFPLLKEYSRKGVDWVLYVSLTKYIHKAGLFNIKEMIPKTGLFKASVLPEMAPYADYIDLDRVIIINDYNTHQRLLSSRLLWLKVFWHMKKQHADIFHACWPLSGLRNILFHLPCKKVLTVHDPISHSNQQNAKSEKVRKKSFKLFDKLVLLSKPLLNEFLSHYNISKEKVLVNKMGEFDYLRKIKQIPSNVTFKYILFFGYISPYKGLEYLCEAMEEVHRQHPDVKLVIAGGGKIYFDWEPFKGKDYIILRNHFVDLPELAGLLHDCEFSVCPYKDATQSGVVQTAFSMGVPMIVTNIGALPEVVKDGQNGLVVPPCDSKALAEAIIRLLANPQKISSMRDNIKDVWQKEMNWEPIANEYIHCYQSLLKS